MRNTMWNTCGGVVGVCVNNQHSYSQITFFAPFFYTTSGVFAHNFSQLSHTTLHKFFSPFMSVIRLTFHIFHTPYNYIQQAIQKSIHTRQQRKDVCI